MTRTELQAILKEYRNQGLTNVKLNSKTEVLQAECDRVQRQQEVKKTLAKLGEVELQLLTLGQVELIQKFFGASEEFASVHENNCKPSLSWDIGAGRAIATFHISQESTKEDFILYTYDGNVSERLRYKGIKFFSVQEFIVFLETGYQLDQHLAVFASPYPDLMGYDPDYLEKSKSLGNCNYLVALTLERIQRLRQPLKRQQLSRIYQGNMDERFIRQFQLSPDEAHLIWYGYQETVAKIMLNAEQGNATAQNVWAQICKEVEQVC